MKRIFKSLTLLSIGLGFLCACNSNPVARQNLSDKSVKTPVKAIPTPEIAVLQLEIVNEIDSKTSSALGGFDFKNFTYPLPRGWQDPDSKVIELENGVRQMTEERIGMSYVTTKFFDTTGDGEDEAFVILKVGTGGSAIPQIVYVFDQKDGRPNLLWYFRTGDRADGGLKRIYAEGDELVVELFGRDRYIFTQMETSKIVGDEQQLCCPTHFTRTRYKKRANGFVMTGDRFTYSIEDKNAEPVRNMNEKRLEEERGTKK